MAQHSLARQLLIPILIFTALLGVIHFFIFKVVSSSLSDASKNVLGILFIDALILLPVGVLVGFSSHRGSLKFLTYGSYIWLGFFHLLFHFSLIELALSFSYPHDYSYWVLWASGVVGIWALKNGVQDPKVNRHWLKAPAFLKGKTIVQISDLHVGMLHLNESWLDGVVAEINALDPDMVAITGDLVEGDYIRISPKLRALNKLKCKNKFYVTGNHEYIHFSGNWEMRLQELGFISLHNSSSVVRFEHGNVLVAGVPDRMAHRMTRGQIVSNPEIALQNSEPTNYKILLAHEPSSVFDLKNEKPDVILSGHTHGGQIFPFSLYVLLQQPLAKGFRRINSVLVFAHQGTGFWGPPMRWLTESEIVVFEFID